MRHLLDLWDAIAASVRSASHVLLLSDYDGTLTRITGRPEEASFKPESRSRLVELCRNPAFTVGVVSGRSLDNVKAHVGINGIYYAGNHGLEIEGPGLEYVNDKATATRPVIADLLAAVKNGLEGIEGVVIEDKTYSLSVHFRLAKENERDCVIKTVHDLAKAPVEAGRIKLRPGKMVWNILPAVDWDKGDAAAKIIETVQARHSGGLSIIYLGDDLTDEDAFQVVSARDGWDVFVGPRNPGTSARYYLWSSDEVISLLERLSDLRKISDSSHNPD